MNQPWPRVRLAELLVQDTNYVDAPEPRVYPKLSVKLYGKGVVLDAPTDGALLKMKRHQLAKPGQVILSEIWGKKGAIGLVPPDGAGALCTSHFFLFDVRNERLDTRWLQAVFAANYLQGQLGADARGTTGYAAVRPKTLVACELPLPPLAEQRRIVTKIERLATRLNEARLLRQQADRAVQQILGSAVRELFIQADETWQGGCLGDYIAELCYGTSERAHDYPNGTPILRMGNIQDGKLDLRELKYLHIAQADRAKWILRRGDILVNRTNSAELVGKCAVVDVEGEWSLASYLIKVRLDPDRADPSLVARYINSPIGRDYMFRERRQMTGQANVNSQTLRALPIRLPPLGTQQRIVAYLDDLELRLAALKKVQEHTATELTAALPAILDRAFKGEL